MLPAPRGVCIPRRGILPKKTSLKNGSAIKSIQRGTLVLSGLSAAATISEINVSKSALNFVGASSKSYASAGTVTTGHHFVRLALTNETTVSASREESNKDATVKL